MTTIRKMSVLFVLSAGSVRLYGQGMSPAIVVTHDRPCDSVQKAVQHASQVDPPVDEPTVSSDLATVRSAQKRVKETYAKRGFDDCASNEATALAWKEMRTVQPRGHLDENALVMLANDGFGGLKITASRLALQ